MAGVALLSWPIIAFVFFAALGPSRGLIWSVTFGYLFLPEGYGFSLEGLPEYNKLSAISAGALIPSLIYYRRVPQVPTIDPLFRTVMFGCLAVLLVSSFGTYLTNTETLVNGPAVRRGLKPWDTVGMTSDLVIWLMPLLLAWRFLRTPDDQRQVLFAVLALGLAYTLLVLFELRMSPQLNNWIYGYFPHSWRQHLRGGGYRPIIFLQHGLWVGFFLFTVVIAAMALGRDKSLPQPLLIVAGFWSLFILMISENLGATMLAFMWVPVVLFLGFRTQMLLVSAVAVIALSYPLLSKASLTPATKLLDVVSTYSPDRARSFQFRLENEGVLLDRALQKPIFGWGGYSRQRLLDDQGRDQTLTDGLWIISIGQRGWVGFLAFFGLLAVPLLFLRRAVRQKEMSPAIVGMAVIMAGNLIYLIPNSALSPIGMMMAGTLAAFVQFGTTKTGETAPQAPTPDVRDLQTRYTRFGPGDTATPSVLSRRTKI